MKTARNNLSNSHAHSGTRNLVISGTEVSWQHIVNILQLDLGVNKAALGLYQTKLTTDHVFLTPRSRMNVSLAVQVLSNTVKCAVDVQDLPSTVLTRNFISHMNKFFDCMNVRTYGGGKEAVTKICFLMNLVKISA